MVPKYQSKYPSIKLQSRYQECRLKKRNTNGQKIWSVLDTAEPCFYLFICLSLDSVKQLKRSTKGARQLAHRYATFLYSSLVGQLKLRENNPEKQRESKNICKTIQILL